MSQLLDNLTILDRLAVKKFRDYLKIPSVHPNVDYEPCIQFLEKYAHDLEMPIKVYRNIPDKPVAVFQWSGRETELSAVMLNGHMDVVPVSEDQWTHKPFGAEIDSKGNIYARGAQDMKCNSIQYLEAIRRLRIDGFVPKRNIFVFFVPEEEMGGQLGMKEFVKTQSFKDMNIGFSLDEGETSLENKYLAYNGEKSCWAFTIHCSGPTGHGSLILKNTAAEKLRYMIDKFSDFRRDEEKKLEDNPSLKPWDVTSVNLTQISGGVQVNVIPEKLSLTYDMRISQTTDVKELEEKINRWCKEAGEGVSVEYFEKEDQRPNTNIDNNPYWLAIEKVAHKRNVKLDLQISVFATDSRFIRELEIPCIGISPIRCTKPLAHDHNECLSINSFLDGLNFYYELIPELANV